MSDAINLMIPSVKRIVDTYSLQHTFGAHNSAQILFLGVEDYYAYFTPSHQREGKKMFDRDQWVQSRKSSQKTG